MMLHLQDCFACHQKNIFYEPELVQRHTINKEDTTNATELILDILNNRGLKSKSANKPETSSMQS